jgi:hypothetical protein
MTTTREHRPAKADEQTSRPRFSGDICATLGELGQSCRSAAKFYRDALRAVASHYESPYSAIRMTWSASTLDERVRAETDDIAMWESAAEDVLLDSQAQNVPISRLHEDEATSMQATVMAVPICE